MILKIIRVVGVAAVVLIGALLTTFAIPVKEWRTGDQGLSPLTFMPVQEGRDVPRRVWIDTDAACGQSARTDPDDCFAIALLAGALDFEIVGVSTVFGNAPLDVVDRTTKELARRLSVDVGRTVPVYSGAAGPLDRIETGPMPPAHDALIAALEQGPLTVMALGPLTNLAAVLKGRPTLQAHVARVVAVMGRRPGHLFHPAEGSDAGILLGHGPIFRDFNFVMDVRAASEVVALNLPMTFVPYDSVRRIEMTVSDLDRLAVSGGALSWVAERARPWLTFWQEDVGRQGFYPFDLIAAAYVVEPRQFECAVVKVWVGEDPTLFIPFWRPTALLVRQDDDPRRQFDGAGSALYCARAAPTIKVKLVDDFHRMARRSGSEQGSEATASAIQRASIRPSS